MIVNSYAVLDLTVSLLRLVVALLVIGLGAHVDRQCRWPIETDTRQQSENRLWHLHNADSFEESVLRAVNLGDDADTPGVTCGQFAGAC